MKLCINCYTENSDDVVFCSKCGMSLMGAPTGEEAIEEAMRRAEEAAALEEKRREEAQRRLEQPLQPLQPLAASGIVYLFGHLFAPPWGASSALGLAGRLAWSLGGDGALDDGRMPVCLPYSGQLVAAGHLGPKLLEAAFVFLAQEGYISLGVEKTKTLFVSGEAVTISQKRSGGDLPPSLERSIMDVLTGAPQERRLKYVVRRLTKVRGLWTPVVYIVMQSLREAQWLAVPERHSLWSPLAPTEEAAPLLAAVDAETVKARLETFAALNPRLHAKLIDELMHPA